MRRSPLRAIALLLVALAWTAFAAPAFAVEDDDIPGTYLEIDLTSGPLSINDSLTMDSDDDDVREVFLYAGETMNLTILDAPGGASTFADFGIYVFDWTAESVWGDVEPAFKLDPLGDGGAYTGIRSLNFTASESGYYYIDVFTWEQGGDGTYTLTVDVPRQATNVVLTTKSSTLPYGSERFIQGSVMGNYRSVTSGRVYLFVSFNGLDYFPWAAAEYSGGPFSLPTGMNDRKTWYLVTYEGDNANMTSSGAVVLGSYAKVGTVVAPATMPRNTARSVYSVLKPSHSAGTYPVRVYKYRYVSGVWKSYGYVNAKAADYFDYSDYTAASKCVASVKLPYSGRWRLRAYAPADAGHAATWSSAFDYVTVP